MPAYPLIDVAVRIGAQELPGEALPDIGYDGTVIVPLTLADEIDQSGDSTFLQVADGRIVQAETWEGELLIGERVFEVAIHSLGDQFIIGREVLNRLGICFEFGERVTIRFER